MDKSTKNFLFIISFFALAIGIYLYRPYGLYFLADDFIHIPESINNLWTQRNSLRPIGNISLHIDYLLSNISAKGYHVTNLLLHLINTFLVFLLGRTLLKKYAENDTDSWFPLIAAGAFFVYPFHSETIFWIIGRSGSLGTLFFLPALILFLQRGKSIFYFIGSLLCFELALLSYESSWVFPLIAIAIVEVNFLKGKKKRETLYVAVVWFVFVLHLFLRGRFTGALFNNYDTGSLLHLSLKSLALNGMRLFARTLLPPFANAQWLIVSLFVAVMFLVALVVKFYRHKQAKPLFVLLTTAWLVSYIPYLSLGIDTHGVEGERYLYMPSVFFCLWLMYVLYKIINKRVQLFFSIVFIAVSFFYLNQSRLYYTKAGNIAKSTIEEVGKLKNKEAIFIENLPQYNNGAIVFRLGFEEAVQWLQPAFHNKCNILSIDSSDVIRNAYYSNKFVVNYSNTKNDFPITQLMLKDKNFKTNYIKTDVHFPSFTRDKHALFVYSDSSLTIFK